MKIKFDAFQISQSPLHQSGKTYSHPAIINQQTIPTDDIAEKASEQCTLTRIDITAVIASLAQHLRLQLLQGNAVRLDGIGTFSPALKFEDPAKPIEDITARDVVVTGVNFTPDGSLLSAMKLESQFERGTALRSSTVSEADAVLALREYFADHSSLSKRTFQSLLGLKYGRATSLLLALVAKDKLTVSRIGQTNFYYAGPTL